MDRTTYEDRQQERIAELRQGILVLTGLYRSAEKDVDFWRAKTDSLTRQAASALDRAQDAIQDRRIEFRRLGADPRYLEGLDDAFGLVKNLAPSRDDGEGL